MRFKRSSGFTLIELIVSVAMLGTLLLFLSPLLGGALGGKTPRELLRKAEVASDSQQLIQRLRFYFSRARDGAFTQGPAVLFLGVNLASSALVVRSDMRPCTTFNPSSAAALLANHVLIPSTLGWSIEDKIFGKSLSNSLLVTVRI